MTKLGIHINKARCIGCHTCVLGCKMQNNVPDGLAWNRILTEGAEQIDGAVGSYPNLTRSFLPLNCQHCENPACLKVCPVGATYKDEMGRVLINYDTCIGCRICMAACPYNARVFNWDEPTRITGFEYGDAPARPKGVAEKCSFCKERTDEGQEPMCVKVCPTRARTFGDLDDPQSAVSSKKRSLASKQLLEELGTRPQVYFSE